MSTAQSHDDPGSLLLDEHDIAELDDLLAELLNDDALHLDGAHGLLSALAVGPEPVPAAEWLPLIVGRTPQLDDPARLDQLIDYLARLYESIQHGLEHYAYDPIFAQRDPSSDEDGDPLSANTLGEAEPVLEVGGWCEGFSMGVDLRAALWEAQMHADPELIELLAPIVQLGVDDGVFSELSDHAIAPLSETERELLIGRLATVLLDVKHYWEEREVIMRAERPPGTLLH